MIQFDDRYKALNVNPSDVFEVYPHNRAFLRGQKVKPEFLKQLPGFWLIFVFGCMTIIVTVFYLFVYTLPVVAAQFGTLTFADLTQPCAHVVKSNCFVEYHYSIGGTIFDGSQSVTANTFLQKYPEHKRIEVKYLPFSPSRSVIVYPQFGDGLDQSIFTTIALYIFTIFFVVLSRFLIAAMIEGTLITILRAKSWPTVLLVVGSVSECVGTWHKIKQGNSFFIRVTFTYQLPDADQVVTKTIHVERNDLPEEIIPFLGKKVIVVVYKTPRSNWKGERRPSPLNFVL